MENRARLNRIFGIALLAAALVVMGWQLALIYISGMRHVLHGLLLILAVCGPLALGTHLLARSFSAEADRPRAVGTTLVGALIVSRVDVLHFAESRADYWDNFDLMTNFRPFETVRLYLNAIRYDYIGMEIPLSNLVGNAMLFMPMAVFLPCLFRPMRRLWLFALTMALVRVAVEALQLLLACGSCDVDDVLLNLTGTLIVFGVLKLPPVKRLLVRTRLMPEAAPPTATAE